MSQDISLNDTSTIVSWRARPRSFVALMSLYESNHVRLSWLTGQLASLSGRHRSKVSGDCELVLNIDERSPYTTTLNLTYLLSEKGLSDNPETLAYPDMRVRVYHDARLVEALEWASTHEHSALRAMRSQAERELDQRWARNMMLNKWLEYCVERGHRFSPATRIHG
jgi:uncharacterized protein YqiB (DUF1249 family)